MEERMSIAPILKYLKSLRDSLLFERLQSMILTKSLNHGELYETKTISL